MGAEEFLLIFKGLLKFWSEVWRRLEFCYSVVYFLKGFAFDGCYTGRVPLGDCFYVGLTEVGLFYFASRLRTENGLCKSVFKKRITEVLTSTSSGMLTEKINVE